jgi:A/G-specific adenine glycosylase
VFRKGQALSLSAKRKSPIPKQHLLTGLPSTLVRRTIQRSLLRWFQHARRPLPWRGDRDPYRIWVSEIMLQQTQVATVIPYFERFLKAFPTVADLANADEQEVLRHWEGLGYYRRAHNLQRACRQVVREHGGAIPDAPEALLQLPGVGRYTMGAILSQAFERRVPIVEANSRRVLCRLFGRAGDPEQGSLRHWLWQMAEALLPARRVGDFNQALMELGALVCTPAAPRCQACPLAELCEARRLGMQEEIPDTAAPPATQFIDEAAVVVRRGETVCLVQRPDHGRWARMWEFPHAPLEREEAHERAIARFLPELTALRIKLGAELTTLRHSVTHHRIRLVCFEARYLSGRFRSQFYEQARWIKPSALGIFPVSAPQRRLAQMLLQPNRQGRLF